MPAMVAQIVDGALVRPLFGATTAHPGPRRLRRPYRRRMSSSQVDAHIDALKESMKDQPWLSEAEIDRRLKERERCGATSPSGAPR
jgi:hypothetical protein